MLYEKTGVTIYNKKKATPGYTMFSPANQPAGTFLIDMEGNVVKHWKHDEPPGNHFYLKPDGNLFGSTRTPEHQLGLPAKGGRIKEIDWDGKVLWEYVDHFQHHDCRQLSNGNVVYVGWELLSKKAQKRVKGGHEGRGDSWI